MAWYLIDMPEESVADGGYHKFCRQFQKAFIGAGAPPELALFACRDSVPSVRRLYMTPDTTVYVPDLIQYYGAQPCGVPEAATVTLVYGVPGAKSLLTPKTEAGGERDVRPLSVDLPPTPKKREAPAIYPLAPARQAASSG